MKDQISSLLKGVKLDLKLKLLTPAFQNTYFWGHSRSVKVKNLSENTFFDSPKSRGQINSKIMNMLLTSEIPKKIFEFRSLNHIIDMCQKDVSDKVRMVPRMKSKF